MMTADSFESVYVARQPVFFRDQQVWGYELLFRSSAEAQGAFVQDDQLATSQVIADGVTIALPTIAKGRMALINFPEELLLSGAAFALPSETCVVEVLENVKPTAEVLLALKKLRKAGFTLAMDDYAGEEELAPFLSEVDILKMDILAMNSDPETIRAAVEKVRPFGLRLLAEKVEDLETFNLCADLGFELFQGFFFSRPEILPGKKVSANEVAKLELLKKLSQPDFELRELAEVINTDPSLSYRLFRYVNSAGMGLSKKVESVTRATAMLGQQKLSQWLRAVILTDLNPSPRAQEVSFLSLHRAKFLQLVNELTGIGDKTPDLHFTLGLFSLLDSLMGMPMDDLLQDIPLESDIEAALLGIENEVTPMLELVTICEHGDFEGMTAFAEHHGLRMTAISDFYTESMRWVMEVLDMNK